MKKLSPAFLLLVFPVFVGAQSLDSTQQIKEVEVITDRLSTPFSQLSRSMTVITAEEIKQLPVQHISEILQLIPGVDLRQRGPQGVQADVGIRGGSFDQTLVLVNGIKMNDPQTGHHALNLMLMPEQIERIEILRGPGTRIYGPGAFAGAINIITKKPQKTGGMLQLGLGENGLYQGRLLVDYAKGKWQQQLGVGVQGSDGYRYNTDFSMGDVFYQSQYALKNGSWYTSLGYNRRNFGANAFYASEQARDQYEETATLFAATGLKISNKKGLENDIRLYFRQHQDDYFFVRQRPAVFHNHHTTRVAGLEWNAQIKSRYGHSGWGAELRQEGIVSKNLGEHQRRMLGLYAEHRWLLGRWKLNPGMYVNYNTDAGLRAYPGIDLGYALQADWWLYGNVGQSFRLPTYTDLYYVGPQNIGNPNLQPESAWNYELGSRFMRNRWSFSAAWFLRDADRVIEWARPLASSSWQALNLLAVQYLGIETELLWRGNGIIRQYSLAYTGISSSFTVLPGWESRYVLDQLQHQLVQRFSIALPYGLQLGSTSRWFQRQSGNGQWVFDAALSYQFKAYRLQLQANNLANEIYREIGTVDMPGRWLRATLRFDF